MDWFLHDRASIMKELRIKNISDKNTNKDFGMS